MMISVTQVDSVGIKLEFNSGNIQRLRLKKLNNYIDSINGLNVIVKERFIGFGAVILEYHVYYKNETVGVVKTGAYKPDKSKIDNIYWIGVVVAGIKSYNEDMDEIKYNFLLTICSWCNDNNLHFRLSELDTDIDINCPYLNFYSMQIKKTPRTRFNPDDRPVYETTRYFQKKPKYKSYGIAALNYDKRVKEGLDDFISRHEMKFTLKKDDVISLESIRDKIINAYARYAVFHFEEISVKDQVMRIEFQIENSDIPKAGAYRRLIPQLEPYRIYPDINYIMDYISTLFFVKKYKMVIIDEKPIVTSLETNSSSFDFDEISKYL